MLLNGACRINVLIEHKKIQKHRIESPSNRVIRTGVNKPSLYLLEAS